MSLTLAKPPPPPLPIGGAKVKTHDVLTPEAAAAAAKLAAEAAERNLSQLAKRRSDDDVISAYPTGELSPAFLAEQKALHSKWRKQKYGEQIDGLRQARAIAEGSSDMCLKFVLFIWLMVAVGIAVYIMVPHFQRILRDQPSSDRGARTEL